MKSFIRKFQVLLYLALLFLIASCALPSNFESIKADFEDSVFELYVYSDSNTLLKSGSAFIVKADGTFITNAHVIDENAVKIIGRFQKEDSVKFIDVEYLYVINETYDYAIGKLESTSTPYAYVSLNVDYQKNDVVYAIGYPEKNHKQAITKGYILSDNYTFDNIEYIPNSAPIYPGSSGGILINKDREVIGITKSMISSVFSDDYYLAVPAKHFIDLLNDPNLDINKESVRDFFNPAIKIDLTLENFFDYFTFDIDYMWSEKNDNMLDIVLNVSVLFKENLYSQVETQNARFKFNLYIVYRIYENEQIEEKRQLVYFDLLIPNIWQQYKKVRLYFTNNQEIAFDGIIDYELISINGILRIPITNED